jgi:hypothetical protein
MNVRCRVELSQAERDELTAMLGGGKHTARKLKRAQILLATDWGGRDEEIARTASVSLSRRPDQAPLRGRQSGAGLERGAASGRRAQANRQGGGPAGGDRMSQSARRPQTLDADASGRHDGQAHRSRQPVGRDRAPPAGRERSQAMAQGHVWCIPHVDGEYVARMEDGLDLYAETPDPARPLVCFDETPVQLIGEMRQPVPGQRERYDYEYRRMSYFVECPSKGPGARLRFGSDGGRLAGQ